MPTDTSASPPAPLTLVVFGANGGSGRALVRQALAAGHRVRAVTRHPDAFPRREDRGSGPGSGARLDVVRGDSTDPRSVADVVAGSDAVLSALGTPYTRHPVSLYSTSAATIVAGMREHGVRRLAVVSSAAVEPGGPSSGFFVDHVVEPLLTRVLGRTLYADMRRMEDVVRASDLDWTVVRPPALYDAEAVGSYRVDADPLAGTYASRQDLADLLLALAVGRPSSAGPVHDGFHQRVAHLVSDSTGPGLLATIWHDGLGR